MHFCKIFYLFSLGKKVTCLEGSETKPLLQTRALVHSGNRYTTRHGHAPWTQETYGASTGLCWPSPEAGLSFVLSSAPSPFRPQWLLTGERPQLEEALNSTRDRSPGRWDSTAALHAHLLLVQPSQEPGVATLTLFPFCGSYKNQSSEPRLPHTPGSPAQAPSMTLSKLLGPEGSCNISLSS